MTYKQQAAICHCSGYTGRKRASVEWMPGDGGLFLCSEKLPCCCVLYGTSWFTEGEGRSGVVIVTA